MANPIITTRAQALAAGIGRYFTGKPCKNGHVAERYTLRGACVDCLEMHRKREEELFRRAQRQASGQG